MTLWKVDGIVAQKHKQRSKAVVLTDSPRGVEWGMGSLLGSFEDGILVWRKPTGKVMYEWERYSPEASDALTLQPKSAQEPKSHAALKSNCKAANGPATAAKGKPPKQPAPKELSSPRSTSSSTVSTAPTDAAPGEVPATSKADTTEKNPTTQEVANLLEMAGSRLAKGDYGAAMQYIIFAQALYPQDPN
jgi:hypothetical protein